MENGGKAYLPMLLGKCALKTFSISLINVLDFITSCSFSKSPGYRKLTESNGYVVMVLWDYGRYLRNEGIRNY